MSLSTVIIKKLKESSIYNGDKKNSNIVLFSDDYAPPPAPYVVVKPENGIIKNTRSYRIIVHHLMGHFDELEEYTLTELDKLLLSDYLKDDDGARYKLSVSGFTDITPEKTDNTYFMERLFYVPLTARD